MTRLTIMEMNMSKKYEVIHGCQIEGKPAKVGDIVELEDRIASKLMALSRPRVKPHVDEEPAKKKKAEKPKKAEENRAVGLPGTEDLESR